MLSYTTVSPSATWTWTISSGFFLAAMSALLCEEPGYPDDPSRGRRDEVRAQLRPNLALVAVEQPRAVDLEGERPPVDEHKRLGVVDIRRVRKTRRARRLGRGELRRGDHRHAEHRRGLG